MKRSPLRRVSKKRQHDLKAYSALKASVLAAQPLCHCCHRKSTDLHHLCPRGRGGPLLARDNVLGLCRVCHRLVHDNPLWAAERGLLLTIQQYNELTRR